MANDLDHNPAFFDGAGTYMEGVAPISIDLIMLRAIAANAVAILIDGANNTLWTFSVPTSGECFSLAFPRPFVARGLQVFSLTNGQLYILRSRE